jgi:imidazolonepropionase-like amidohydrolase
MRFLSLLLCLAPALVSAQRPAAAPANPPKVTLLVPTRVWDGVDNQPHEGWAVLVRGDRIEAVGPRAQLSVPNDATTIDLAGTTLMPGLIEGHSHLLLHPYNETPWDDQVLHEALALRVGGGGGGGGPPPPGGCV